MAMLVIAILTAGPLALVVALALRGSGGLKLTPVESLLTSVVVLLGGTQVALLGSVTLDDRVFAPILLGLPIATAIHFGMRVAFASNLAGWLILIPISFASSLDGIGEDMLDGFTSVGGVFLAAGVACLAASYAGFLTRVHRLAAPLPMLLWLGPYLTHPARPLWDPLSWATLFYGVFWAFALTALMDKFDAKGIAERWSASYSVDAAEASRL